MFAPNWDNYDISSAKAELIELIFVLFILDLDLY